MRFDLCSFETTSVISTRSSSGSLDLLLSTSSILFSTLLAFLSVPFARWFLGLEELSFQFSSTHRTKRKSMGHIPTRSQDTVITDVSNALNPATPNFNCIPISPTLT